VHRFSIAGAKVRSIFETAKLFYDFFEKKIKKSSFPEEMSLFGAK